MAAAELTSLGGLDTLIDNPARVILTDNPREADALATLTPLNPRVWFPGLAADASLDALTGRTVVVWVSRPTAGYWLAGSATAWLRRLLTVTQDVSVVAAEDAVGPRQWTGSGLGEWLNARLVPATDLLPSNVTPIRQPAPRKTAPANPTQLAEDTLARAFTAKYPHLRYVGAWGKWYEWEGSRWIEDDTGRVMHYARELCVSEADAAAVDGAKPDQIMRAKKASTRASVENLCRFAPEHAVKHEIWDGDGWALCTPGGIVDLTTGDLRPATPDDYVTKQTTATPRGECPLWMKFLNEATNGDAELQGYLQRVAGYMLTGSTREECFFFAYGPGGNGKGVFINTLTAILGEYAMTCGMEVFTESAHDRHTTELARLRGARMVSAQETEEGKRWAEGRLKMMTGRDQVTARFMRQDDFSFTPQFKLILAGNHRPVLRSLDDAMKRRINLIPFTVKFDASKRDIHLKDKLMQEADGILAWAVRGCVAWNTGGLATPVAVRDATADYFEDQDQIKHWAADCCEIGPSHRGAAQALYESFRQWCEDSGERFILPLKRFRQKLIDAGHEDMRTKQGKFFKGIKLADSMTMARGYQQDDIPGF